MSDMACIILYPAAALPAGDTVIRVLLPMDGAPWDVLPLLADLLLNGNGEVAYLKAQYEQQYSFLPTEYHQSAIVQEISGSLSEHEMVPEHCRFCYLLNTKRELVFRMDGKGIHPMTAARLLMMPIRPVSIQAIAISLYELGELGVMLHNPAQSVVPSPACKADCREFMSDHYATYQAFPVEFEYEDVVYPFSLYMSWFSDEDLREIELDIEPASVDVC
ncbi:hypothetical protein D3C78_111970 [compost metagenome]